jgi:two-component system response regulator DegU
MRELLRRLFGDLAQEIYECGDGTEALTVYARHRPDRVLREIELAGQDGLRATRQIVERWPGSQVAVLTLHDDARLRAAATQAGACAYWRKQDLHLLPAWLRAAAQQ